MNTNKNTTILLRQNISDGYHLYKEAMLRLDTCTMKVESIERFKRLVEQNYKEPVNGQFDDCTKEVSLEVDMKGSSDDEDQEIASE